MFAFHSQSLEDSVYLVAEGGGDPVLVALGAVLPVVVEVDHLYREIHRNYVHIQGDQLNMSVFIWFLLKVISTVYATVHVYTGQKKQCHVYPITLK